MVGMPKKKASTMRVTTYRLRRHFMMSLWMPIEVPHDWGIYHAMFIAFCCLHVMMGAESFFLWFRLPSSLLVCNTSCMTSFHPARL